MSAAEREAEIVAYRAAGMAIPPHMTASLARYIEDHAFVGSFLEAVISNDLKKAVEHADHENFRVIPVYVRYLYNCAPMGCWGSPLAYERWTNRAAAEPEGEQR